MSTSRLGLAIERKKIGRALEAVSALLLLCASVHSQTTTAAQVKSANTGSLSGSVRDESGLPVEALVTVATQGLQQHSSTPPDGTFQFANLKPGKYVVCARAWVSNPKPQDAPFVDACLWQDRSSLQVALAPGQSRTGVSVPVKHGYMLKVRVNDPLGQLPAAVGPIGGNALSIHIAGPSAVAQDVPIVGQDSSGRDQAIVIPYDVPHQLIVHSTKFVLKDASGKQIDASTPIAVTVAPGGPPKLIVINVDRPKP